MDPRVCPSTVGVGRGEGKRGGEKRGRKEGKRGQVQRGNEGSLREELRGSESRKVGSSW